jgi:hypothetical protein
MSDDPVQRKSDQKWEVPNPGLPAIERPAKLPEPGASHEGENDDASEDRR